MSLNFNQWNIKLNVRVVWIKESKQVSSAKKKIKKFNKILIRSLINFVKYKKFKTNCKIRKWTLQEVE